MREAKEEPYEKLVKRVAKPQLRAYQLPMAMRSTEDQEKAMSALSAASEESQAGRTEDLEAVQAELRELSRTG